MGCQETGARPRCAWCGCLQTSLVVYAPEYYTRAQMHTSACHHTACIPERMSISSAPVVVELAGPMAVDVSIHSAVGWVLPVQ
jgi:hypothetical protein